MIEEDQPILEVRIPEGSPSRLSRHPSFRPGRDFGMLKKLQREKTAFFRLLPELLISHKGQFVLVHDEHVIDSDPDHDALVLRGRSRQSEGGLYINLVTDNPPAFLL